MLEVAELAVGRGGAEQSEEARIEPIGLDGIGDRLPVDRQCLLRAAAQLEGAREVAAEIAGQRLVRIALAQGTRRLLVQRERPLDVAGGQAGDRPVVLDPDRERRAIASQRGQLGERLGVEAIRAVVAALQLLGIGEVAEQRCLQLRIRALGRLQDRQPGLGAALRGCAVAFVLGDERHLLVAVGDDECRQRTVAQRRLDLTRAGLGIAQERDRKAVQAARLGAQGAVLGGAKQGQGAAQLGLGLRRIAHRDVVRRLRQRIAACCSGLPKVIAQQRFAARQHRVDGLRLVGRPGVREQELEEVGHRVAACEQRQRPVALMARLARLPERGGEPDADRRHRERAGGDADARLRRVNLAMRYARTCRAARSPAGGRDSGAGPRRTHRRSRSARRGSSSRPWRRCCRGRRAAAVAACRASPSDTPRSRRASAGASVRVEATASDSRGAGVSTIVFTSSAGDRLVAPAGCCPPSST